MVAAKTIRYDSVMSDYKPMMHIVLHQPEIPPNTGAVGRTCLALGFKLWLVKPLGFQVDEKTLRRAGLDYWQHLNWEVVDHWQQLREKLVGSSFYYFSKKATTCYLDIEFKRNDVLVFGSETTGLPESFLQNHEGQALRIPMRSEVRSLNLSASVAVAGYEAIRQIDHQVE